MVLSEDNLALVCQAGKTMLRIQKVDNFCLPEYTVPGWEVNSIEFEVARLNALGVVLNDTKWDTGVCVLTFGTSQNGRWGMLNAGLSPFAKVFESKKNHPLTSFHHAQKSI
jgi:hypothetical protein